MEQQFTNALPQESILQGPQNTYTIQHVLGQGSFGITYLATTEMSVTGQMGSFSTTVYVAVKEFFMKGFNGRQGCEVTAGSQSNNFTDNKRKFIREAEKLSTLRHDNIVKVLESFEANGTAYYAMEYIGGGSLDDYIAKNNGIAEAEALPLIRQIGSALNYMHTHNMLHLDLKPGNIMMRSAKEAVIIDFGLSKQFNEKGEPESSTSLGGGTPGYAPLEQANYQRGDGLPVTLDVYAFGATVFKMLTGVRPPEASVILNNGFPYQELRAHNVSSRISKVVAKAMSPMKRDRIQSVPDFIYALENVEDTEIRDDDEPTPEEDTIHYDAAGKDYVIRPDTKCVQIEYSPATPCPGQYVAFIRPNEVRLGMFDGTTHIVLPSDCGTYNKFLYELQNLNLSIRGENTGDWTLCPVEYSEEPEKLTISLYDNLNRRYAQYWIGGWHNEQGNIVGNTTEIKVALQNITPHLKEFLSKCERKKETHTDRGKLRDIISMPGIFQSQTNPDLEIEIAGLSAIGRTSTCNYDNYGWKDTPNGFALVVCDGSQSKHKKGMVASTIAVKSIIDSFERVTSPSTNAAIHNAIRDASAVLRANSSDLSSTGAVTLIHHNRIYWGSVGNCRIYNFRASRGLVLLSKDQSYVQELVDKGKMSPEEAQSSPQRKLRINQMGNGMYAHPNISPSPVTPERDDILLMCSGGLTEFVAESKIAKILRSATLSLREKVERLKEAAMTNGGEDDITIVAIRFSTVGDIRIRENNVGGIKRIRKWVLTLGIYPVALFVALLLITVIVANIGNSEKAAYPDYDDIDSVAYVDSVAYEDSVADMRRVIRQIEEHGTEPNTNNKVVGLIAE